MPGHGSDSDEEESLGEFDEEDGNETGFKLGEDINYKTLLDEHRAQQALVDLQGKQTGKKRASSKALKKAHKLPKIQLYDTDDEDEDMEDTEEEPKSLLARNLEITRTLEDDRIKTAIQERKEERAKQREYIDELAFQGLVGVGKVMDQALGYDGSFGDHIQQNEELKGLMSETLAHECSDTKKTIQQYGKMGFMAVLGLEYLSYRSINVGAWFAAPEQKPQLTQAKAPVPVVNTNHPSPPIHPHLGQPNTSQVLEPGIDRTRRQ